MNDMLNEIFINTELYVELISGLDVEVGMELNNIIFWELRRELYGELTIELDSELAIKLTT